MSSNKIGVGASLNFGSKTKHIARQETIVDQYWKYVGKSLPDDQQYWCLCSEQLPGCSEIDQLVASGLLKTTQFVGVDLNANKIEGNRIAYPTASWYAGDWLEVIEDAIHEDRFNPGLIYLDTISVISTTKLFKQVIKTMMFSPIGTMLVVNMMLNNPYSRRSYKPELFIELLSNELPSEIGRWRDPSDGYCYVYNSESGQTDMTTFTFIKHV